MAMKGKLYLAAVLLLPATPAQATGGLVCRTAGDQAIEVSLGFPHGFGAPLFLVRLRDNGRAVPVSAPQWWLDDSELRLLLFKPNEHRQELLLKARRNGHVYDGSLWRGGKRHWVRCRED
jgi:hypothetical protein